jgi:hypothetical protein
MEMNLLEGIDFEFSTKKSMLSMYLCGLIFRREAIRNKRQYQVNKLDIAFAVYLKFT